MATAVMQFQLREYTVEDGRLDDFVREWRELVLPLRQALGFNVLGPWIERESNRFVWMIGFDGDLAAANEEYYASPQRAAMDPDPARLIAEIRAVSLEAP
jgi:hypothetical protein